MAIRIRRKMNRSESSSFQAWALATTGPGRCAIELVRNGRNLRMALDRKSSRKDSYPLQYPLHCRSRCPGMGCPVPFRRTAESFSSEVHAVPNQAMVTRRIICVLALLCSCFVATAARAQQQQEPEDPEDDKQIGLWLDQGISTGLSPNTSLEIEFHERFDEGASNLFEYFVQGGVAFRLRPWLTLIPIYRYQRYPLNPGSLTKTGCSSISP